MKKYIKEKSKDPAFSLHDARIIDFKFDYDSMSLTLVTDHGYINIAKNEMVEGDIMLQDISIEDSYVYILNYQNVLCGNVGSFIGEKMKLETFIEAYPSKFLGFDVIDEYDGYRTFIMNGFLSRKGEIPEDLEASFEIYYKGDFVYQVRD